MFVVFAVAAIVCSACCVVRAYHCGWNAGRDFAERELRTIDLRGEPVHSGWLNAPNMHGEATIAAEQAQAPTRPDPSHWHGH